MLGFRVLRAESEQRHLTEKSQEVQNRSVPKEQVPWALIHSFSEKNPDLKDEFQA